MDVSGLGTPNTATPRAGGALSGDFQTFLTMLTVQMRNQDPLNPMNASDFAVQLATFSGVEQQTYTNQLLSSLLSRSSLADLGAWVGMEARTAGSAVFDGTPIALAPEPAEGADAVTLVVRDARGAVVDSRPLATSVRDHVWDGLTASGTPLPDGSYSFELVSSLRGETLETRPVDTYQAVVEARHQDGATLLVLAGNRIVDSSAVSGLRRPAG